MTTSQALSLIASAALAAGPIGTIIESAGKRFGLPKLVSFGQFLEDLGANLPGLLGLEKRVAK